MAMINSRIVSVPDALPPRNALLNLTVVLFVLFFICGLPKLEISRAPYSATFLDFPGRHITRFVAKVPLFLRLFRALHHGPPAGKSVKDVVFAGQIW
jgi:hypothetical protein